MLVIMEQKYVLCPFETSILPIMVVYRRILEPGGKKHFNAPCAKITTNQPIELYKPRYTCI